MQREPLPKRSKNSQDRTVPATTRHHHSNAGRLSAQPNRAIAALLLLFVAGCTDPAAVRSFAGEAPPPGSFTSMLDDYSALGPAIAGLAEISARQCPEKFPADQSAEVIHALEPMHESWVAYMAALGRLADDQPVQRAGADTTQVTAGLTAIQKALPSLGITANQITLIGDLTSLVAQAAVRKLREDALQRVIAEAEPAFQTALALESRVISRAYVPDLASYNAQFQSLSIVMRRSFAAGLGAAPATGVIPSRQAVLQQACLANAIATGEAPTPVQVAAHRRAAEAYVSALAKLAAAHTKLFKSRGHVLTRATYDQLKPLLDQADRSWADVRTVR
jgi:hypothetical protein